MAQPLSISVDRVERIPHLPVYGGCREKSAPIIGHLTSLLGTGTCSSLISPCAVRGDEGAKIYALFMTG
jgi:hypothetical protein